MAMSTISIVLYGAVSIFAVIFIVSALKQHIRNQKEKKTGGGTGSMPISSNREVTIMTKKSELQKKLEELQEKKDMVELQKQVEELDKEMKRLERGDTKSPLKKGAQDTWKAWNKFADGFMKTTGKLQEFGDKVSRGELYDQPKSKSNSNGSKRKQNNRKPSGGVSLGGSGSSGGIGIGNDIGHGSGGVKLDNVEFDAFGQAEASSNNKKKRKKKSRK